MKHKKELSTSINEPRQALLPVISSTKLTYRALQKALFLGPGLSSGKLLVLNLHFTP